MTRKDPKSETRYEGNSRAREAHKVGTQYDHQVSSTQLLVHLAKLHEHVPLWIAEDLQAERDAYTEDREGVDCNVRQPRLENESSGACPGDLPSWRDLAEDPYLLFLQLTMVAEGHGRQQIIVSPFPRLNKLYHC